MGMNKIYHNTIKENYISSLFKKPISKKTTLFLLTSASILFCFGMLLYRLKIIPIYQPIVYNSAENSFVATQEGTFIFLVWNLFLAWIPYAIAISLDTIYKKINSKILLILILMIWLFFFPNAPYIITDFVHLKRRFHLPYWYDILMLYSFAGTGLVLGLLSLLEVEKFLLKITSKLKTYLFIFSSIPLCGIGIWMGRYQRWNSWDVVTRPHKIIQDVGSHFYHYSEHMNEIGISVAISIILLLSYLFMKTLMGYSLEKNN